MGQTVLVLLFLGLVACTARPSAYQDPLPTYLSQAETSIGERRYGEAVQRLEEAAEIYPASLAPLLKIGQIYLVQQRWLPAEDAFNRALARDLENPVATAGLAEALLNQGKSGRALALWREAIGLNPKLPGVFTGLGRTHLVRLEFEAAREAFLSQQTHRPDPTAQWFLAVLAAPRNISTANDHLLAIPPEAASDVLARRDYLLASLVPFTAESPAADVATATGIAMVQAELWPLAIHALTSAHQQLGNSANSQNSLNSLNSKKAETQAFLGHALAQAGRPALELFEQAHEVDPDSALPAYFYGIYLRQQGALRAAEEEFKQAMALDPDNAAIYIELARTKAEQGDFIAAEVQYETAATVAKDDVQIQLARVRFYATRGYNLVEAGIPAAEAVLDDFEDNAEGHDLLGWMQFLSGELDTAEMSLRRAIELDPDLVSAHYHLARYLEVNGQTSRAAEEYQHVIDRDTSGIFRSRALKDLQRLRL
jgi:tetratricopeptide (TPR) repeat protein